MALIKTKQLQTIANLRVLGNTSGSTASPSQVVILDEDNFASDSATALATQQSIKAYVDANAGGAGSLSITDGTNSDTITVGTDTLTFEATANETTVVVSDNKVTIGLPDNVTISGNLTVSGTTTTVNSTEVSIADKALVLANGSTDAQIATANGAGLKIGSESSPLATLLYDGVDSFDVSDHINLASGQAFKIATTTVLDADGASKVKATVAGTGLAHSSGSLEVDVSSLSAMSAQVDIDADAILLYDASADSHLKITPQALIENIFTDISSFSTPNSVNYSFLTYDSTSGQEVLKRASLTNLTSGILQAWSSLGSTEITGADNFLLYDAGDSAPKEITFTNLGTRLAGGTGLAWSSASHHIYVDRASLAGDGLDGSTSTFKVKGFDNFDANPSSGVSVPGSGSTAISFSSSIPNYVGDVRVSINGIQVNSNAYAYTGGGTPSLAWTSDAPFALETDDLVSITGNVV